MSNVTILVRSRPRPAMREAIFSAIEEVARAAREEEACLAYDCYISDTSRGEIVVVQTWETQRDYEIHNRSSEVSALFERHESDLLEPPYRLILSPTCEQASI